MTATFYVGDAVTVMNTLPEKSVDLILTSPPFLALRSYLPADHPDKALEGGSQSTPGEYIDWLLDVVEACARVLAPHGSLVFELGDTYSGSGGAGGDYADDGLREGQPTFKVNRGGRITTSADLAGKGSNVGGHHMGGNGWPLAKSLSLIPETFRWAMVYGHNPFTGRKTEPWRLRNVIRWVRPNPPVGALGDKFRPATSELMVFCKSKDRFFDLDAVREPHKIPEAVYKGRPATLNRTAPGQHTDPKNNADQMTSNAAGAPPLDWWNIPLLDGEEPTRYGPKEEPRSHARTAKGVESAPRSAKSANRGGNWATLPELHETQGAPPLDWWNIPPGGYPGAHYAVWPPELLVKPIKAMCPEKVCRRCGEASRRIVEQGDADYAAALVEKQRQRRPSTEHGLTGVTKNNRAASLIANEVVKPRYDTIGWTDCGHDDYRPGIVLDPFAGSGTTLAVATGHGRDAIGIDLDDRNYELALDRVGPLVLERGEVAA